MLASLKAAIRPSALQGLCALVSAVGFTAPAAAQMTLPPTAALKGSDVASALTRLTSPLTLPYGYGVGALASTVPGAQSGYNAWYYRLEETNPGDLQKLTFQTSGGVRTGGIWVSNASTMAGLSRQVSQANDPADATANTSAASAEGSVTLTFNSVPALAVSGGYIVDVSNPLAITSGTTISGAPMGTTVTLSASVTAPGVSSGDQIAFYGARYQSNQNLRQDLITNSGSNKVAVTYMPICNATVAYAKCQTTNPIALSTAHGASHMQLNAMELDLEDDSSNSYDALNGLLINDIGPSGGIAILTGAGPGNWGIGLQTRGISSTGVAISPGQDAQIGSELDTGNGAYGYSAGAIMVSNYGSGTGAGAGQFVGFRGASCCSANARIYEDGSNLFNLVNLGGGVAITPFSGYPVVSNGRSEFHDTAPAVVSGTSATVVGNENVGRVIVGTVSSTVTVVMTFAHAWTNVPICFAQNETTNVTMRATTVSTTSVTFTASGNLATADKISYRCEGYQ